MFLGCLQTKRVDGVEASWECGRIPKEVQGVHEGSLHVWDEG